ncbi:hypothetical protein ACFV98_39230 [Streptomyces violascens]|uniref:NucA/NucB deoxyribonuclease domain-containing protein n=1 Tax=Streptomyces violascens TaxID=67381 RepID=UPI00365452B3
MAVAGVLLLGTGGAQAAGPGPAHRHTSRVYLTVSPETPKKIPGGNVPFKRQTAPGSGSRPDAITPAPLDSISVNDCLAHAATSSRGNGWASGRHDSCQSYHLHTWKVDCDWWFCSQVGSADADLVDYQFTPDGKFQSRHIYVEQFIGNWSRKGEMSGINLTLNTTCRPTQGSGPCQTNLGSPTTEPVDAWVALGNQYNWYYFEQPKSSGVGNARVSYANLSWHLLVTGGENGPVTRDGPNSQVRCDSASYILYASGGEGCVFPWAPVPTWTIHRSATPEAAQNIYEAQTRPLTTQPPSTLFGVPFKLIVGAPSTYPLHRDAVADHIEAHRTTAQQACRRFFPGRYPAPHTDCDEYPFASTTEGSVNYGNFRNYVVKPIDSDDNQAAGRDLGLFYATERLLGDDGFNEPFHVSVQP